MQINGKRIVLTGAASGIGRELLMLLAGYDAEIVAVDVNREQLAESIRAPQGARASLMPFVCDLSTQTGTDEVFDYALGAMKGIDIFIANAGFARYGRYTQPDWADMQRMYAVNVFSPVYTAAKMANINPQNPYLMVMTASSMGIWAMAGYSIYASTKGALHRFADAYRYEMPAHGRLMMVYPIGTRTAFFKTAEAPPAYPLQDASAVAKAMLRGILTDQRDVYPSWSWRISAVVNHVLPIKWAAQRIYVQMLRDWEARH